MKSRASRVNSTITNQASHGSIDNEINIQTSILRFLGRLGGENQQILYSQTNIKKSISWCNIDSIFINLPILQLNNKSNQNDILYLTVVLDRLLPRIVELCSHASFATPTERQVCLLAAESLHSIIIMIVGNSAISPNRGKIGWKSEFASIYNRVFPIVVNLSVCSDIVVSQLYSKLLYQLIHWFSASNQVHADEADALVEALTQGLCIESDSSLRDQCSSAINEFFQWSIKQSTKKELAFNPASSEAILKRLFMLATQSSESHRLGASLAFAKLRTNFREQTSLVNYFSLSIVHVLLMSLRLDSSTTNVGGLGINSSNCNQIIETIINYTEIVFKSVYKRGDLASLMKYSDKRVFPHSLSELVKWLWDNISNSNPNFRSTCMKCFLKLSPLVINDNSNINIGHFSKDNQQDMLNYISNLSIEKASNSSATAIHVIVTTIEGVNNVNVDIASNFDNDYKELQWLLQLNGMIDAYSWLIQSNIIEPSRLFLSSTTSNSDQLSKKRKTHLIQPNIFRYINNFMIRISTFDHSNCIYRQDISKELKDLRVNVVKLSILLIYSIMNYVDVTNDINSSNTSTNNELLCQFGEYFRSNNIWCETSFDVIMKLLLWTRFDNIFPSLSDTNGLSLFACTKKLFNYICYLDNSDNDNNRIVSFISTKIINSLVKLENIQYNMEEMGALFRCIILIKSSNKYVGNSQSLSNHIFGEESTIKKEINRISLNIIYKIANFPIQTKPHQLSIGLKLLELSVNCLGSSLFISSISSVNNETNHHQLINLSHINDLLFLDRGRAELFFSRYGDNIANFLINIKEEKLKESFISLINLYKSGRDKNKDTEMIIDSDDSDSSVDTNSIAKGLVLRLLSTSISMLINNIRIPAATITYVISSCLETSNTYVNQSNTDVLQSNNNIIPHQLLLQLVKLDAKLPVSERNKDLFILLKQDILNHLNNCSNYSCEDICLRIKLIPYLVDGITRTCPRLLSQSSSVSEADTEELINALEEMVAVKFPMQSVKMDHTTVSGKEYNALLREYLSIISSCGSIPLFEPLKISLKEGYSHKYSDLIITSLQNLVNLVDLSLDFDKFKLIPPISDENKEVVSMSTDTFVESSSSLSSSFKAIISYVLSIIFNEKEKLSIKILLMDKLLIPLLNRCTSNVLVALFTSKSKLFNLKSEDSLVKFISNQIDIDPNIKTGDKKINFIFIQSCCYKFFQIMFDKCLLQSIQNEIKFALGVEINGKLIKNSWNSIRRIILVDDSDINNNLVQRLYSEIYSFLLISVTKTQTKENNYDNFLFNDKNNNPFFIRAINCMKTYKFKAISGKFDTIYLGSSFNSNNDDNGLNSNSFSSNRDISGSKNLPSQYLQGSSLGECRTQSGGYYPSRGEIEEIGGIDDTNNKSNLNVNRTSSSENIDKDVDDGDDYDDANGSKQYDVEHLTHQHNKSNNNETEIDHGIYVQGFDDQLIELELNDLNKQICMSSMIRTIQRMNILFSDKWNLNTNVLPNWLSICHKHLSNSNASINLRLFILRLFLNQPIADIVKPYINILLESILDCCNNDLCNESNNNIGFHYFLRDIVNILNDSWANVRPNSAVCEQKASLFLNNLIQRAYEADTSVLVDNCRGIADLINLWLGKNDENDSMNDIFTSVNLELDLSPIVSLLQTEAAPTGGAHAAQSSKGSEGVRKRLAGIQLLSDILHAGYPLFDNNSSYCNGSIIYNALIDCVKFPRKEVCCNASKCCAYILHITVPCNDNSNADLIPECKEFKAKLETVLNSKNGVKDGIDSICSCLQGIVKEFPSFLSRSLLVQIIGRINSVKSRSKYEFLDALYSTTTDFEDISIPIKLSDHLHSLLSDLFTVVLGRGTDNKAKIPVIQLYTLKILTKYIKDIDVKLLELLIYGSDYNVESVSSSGEMEGVLSLVIDERAIYQVRKEAFIFLLKLTNCISNDEYFAGKDYDENSIKSMRKTLRILLLKGLSASCEGDGMDEMISNNKDEKNTTTSSSSSGFNISSEGLNSISNQSISAAIYSYFNDYYGLSKDPYQRIHILMTDLFDLNCMSHWLNYTTYLLLSLSTSTKEFSQPLFNRNLTDECNFIPMQVNSNDLRNRKQFDRSQTPLFSFNEAIKRSSQSQSQFSSQFGSQFGTASTWMGTFSMDKTQRDVGYLRDTQAMQWTQTQEGSNQTQGISSQFIGVATQSNSGINSTQNRIF
jgi:hypothetical protein